ncbi:pleckstrin homology domain-containing family G member 3 isoform X10 [Delphinapterus leucas]|uniref:Pleckstrin homology domain-containing family G member 3 isoform X10 n=1 Tax=Delphinapterus leucas TaxID=9749 RepID=A0A7F8KH67_DELLE|nr:pleckstrin homology domain-containing family G member 3 isoform X10 [Delphinapterus leucas]
MTSAASAPGPSLSKPKCFLGRLQSAGLHSLLPVSCLLSPLAPEGGPEGSVAESGGLPRTREAEVLRRFQNLPGAPPPGSNARMPVSASLHQDGSQERPVSLTSTTSSSGSSRDSRGAMEEPSGSDASAENGAGSPRGRRLPNNNSGSWLSMRGSLSPFSSRASVAPAHKLSYVGRVVREIVETERTYVQDLRSIVEDYLLKIIDTPGLLNPEQVSALFGNIESIYALNSQLLRDLDSCNSDPVAVASCFVERSQEFDIYTQYCNNYPNSVAALTECMQDKQQAKFFRDRQELLQHSLPLGSYLLKPVQRILKYHLLLQEIAKHFDEEEDGFEVVEDAIDTMTCVAWYINDMKRRHEHAVRLQEIQSLLINWKGPDLTTYGELVLEGTFRVHRVRNEKTFFLFDKALLITKKRGDHFVYKGHIPMVLRGWGPRSAPRLVLDCPLPLPQCSSLMLIESTRESPCFTVTHYKHSKQQYNIQAKTVEEKRSWTHHIKRLILENHHTTIPQKAKEAILEMDSYYPNRYRHSPERLKKASQDEASTHVHQGRRQSEPSRHLLRQHSEKARAAGMKGKGRREPEDPKSCRRPSSRSPTTAEKCLSFESVSSLPEVEPDPESGTEQEVSAAMEGPRTEEMPSDTEAPEVLEIQLDTHQLLLGLDPPGDMVDFMVAESTEDPKVLSSEDEEEEVGAAHEPESLLPPSVLDQASVIAERFVSSFSRRSSLALEDGKSSGFGTPRLTSRSSSVVSLEDSEKGLARRGSTTDPLGSQLPPEADISMGVAAESDPSVNGTETQSPGCPAEPDRPSCTKESKLSSRDRLLLDKIKSYYESAEHHDAGFSVRRRESLSFIPKGLVRNSVSRINSLPRPDSEPVAALGHKRQVGSRAASWALFDYPGPGQARAGDPAPITDAEFRPSSEIVKIWEEVESPEGSPGKGPGQGQANSFDLHEPLFILEDRELGAITEESAAASPERASPTEPPSPAHLARELKELVKELSSGTQGELVTPLHPRILQLSHVMDSHVSERVKSKVYQLARQYSLRIKSKSVTARPPQPWEKVAATTPHLQPEAGAPSAGRGVQAARCLLTGKRKPVLSLFNHEQPTAQEHSPPKSGSAREVSPRRSSFSPSATSPRTTSPGAWHIPRSPLSPLDTETFNWPDVRELCSKYASQDEALQAKGSRPRNLPVNRSHSLPENMMQPQPPLSGKVGRCCSLNARRAPAGPGVVQPQPLAGSSPSALGGGEALYVTADLTLEDSRRMVIMEKGPLSDPNAGLEAASGRGPSSPAAQAGQGPEFQECAEYRPKEEGPRDLADPSQQGRVRSLREKFQALNSTG